MISQLLIFILISYGISNIIVFGSIFEKFRNFWEPISPKYVHKLLTCMICLPTWIGFMGSALIWSPTEAFNLVTHSLDVFGLFMIPKGLISVFLDGCLTSGSVWLIHTFQEHLEK